jgi:hypothetical protein
VSISSPPWTLSETAPVPQPRALPAVSAPPGFATQLLLGLAIFAGVLGSALPFAFVSEGLALAAAVAVGSVLVALFARRRRIALMVATLLAVLGAFAATHSVHLALQQPNSFPIPLAALAPAAGETSRLARPAQLATAVATPVRTEIGGIRIPVAGWAFPAALFVFWVVGFAAMAANRQLARWAWHRIAQRLHIPA